MKNKRNIYKILIYIIVFIGSVYFLYKSKDEFSELRIQNYILILPLIILNILFFISNGLVTKIIIEIFNVRLSFKEWLGLSVTNTLGNYISPFRGGSISNALYLKKRYSFSYTSFISMLSGTYIIIFWINSLVGIISLILTNIFYDIYSSIILILFIFSFISLSFIIIIAPRFPATRHTFINKFIQVINDWNIIRKKVDVLFKISLIAVLNIIIMTLMSYIEFQLIGIKIGLLKLLVISLFSTFSIFLSITPANLGIREAFSIYSGQLLGIPISQVLAVSIIDRLINFLLSLILGVYYSNILLNKTSENVSQKDNNPRSS